MSRSDRAGAPARPAPPPARVQLAAVFRKEVLQTVRDRRVLFVLVIAPLVQTLVLGFAANFEVDRVPAVVVDRDATPTSRAFTRGLLADGTLLGAGRVESPAAAERALDRDEASAAIILPPRLEADLDAGRPAEVQVVLDGTDPTRSTVAGAAASSFFAGEAARRAAELLAARGAPPPPALAVAPRLFYNPALASSPYMIPGIAATLLLLVTTVVSAMGLAREREMGTLEQVLVTPLRPAWLLAGKTLPYVVIGLFDVLLLMAAGTWVFGVPLRGPLWVAGLGTLLYLLTTLGVGLFISTVSASQSQAFLGAFLFIMPAILLSGVMSPIAAMPPWLQSVTVVNPVRHFAFLMRAVLLRGAGVADLLPQLGALAGIGVLVFSMAALRFRKTLG